MIVDTQASLGTAITQALTSAPAMKLVVMAQDYAEAEKLVAQLSPAIIWLEINSGHDDAIAEIRRLKEISPISRILVITDKENEQEAFAAIMAGAQGFRSRKTLDPEEIPSLLQMLLHDECVIRPALLLPLMQSLRSVALSLPEQAADPRPAQFNSSNDERTQLTNRERAIVQFIRQGYRDSDIARLLHLSERAVRRLVQRILSKFGL